VLDDEDAIEQEILPAYDALIAAWGALAIKANFASLTASIALADGIVDNANNYVPASIVGLADALATARIAAANPDATQAQVNAAVSALNVKILAARLLPNKSALLAAYNAAKISPTSLTTAISEFIAEPSTVHDQITIVENQNGAVVIGVAEKLEVDQKTTVKVKASEDAELKTIKKSTGKLSPAFRADVTSYTLTIPKSKSTVKITPVKTDKNEKIEIRTANGKYRSVTSVNVKVVKGGNKTVWIKATSEDDATKTYKITVIRKK
jgi:flavin-binding protein dodecin